MNNKRFITGIAVVAMIFIAVMVFMYFYKKPLQMGTVSEDGVTDTPDKDAQQKIYKDKIGQNVQAVPVPEKISDLQFPAYMVVKSGANILDNYEGGDIIRLHSADSSGQQLIFRGGIAPGAEGMVVGEYYIGFDEIKEKTDWIKKV